MGRTKTTAKPDPLTEPASPLSLPPPLRRRSLRLSPAPNSEPPAATRVSTAKGKKNPKTMSSNGDEDGNKIGKGFLNLRSGKKVLKRGETTAADDDDDDDSLGNSKKRKIEEEEQTEETDEGGNDELTAGKSNVDDEGEGEGESSQRKPPPLSREEKGKTILVVENKEEEDEESIMEINNLVINDSPVSVPLPVPVPVPEQARNSAAAARENGARRNEVMERFRDIARENASRFAHFASDGEDDDGDRSSVEPEEELENEDWPGPFSTAIKIIRDRENKGDVQTGFAASSQANLIDSIKWVPKTTEREEAARFNVPSLQEMCLQILSRNVDAIVSLESVPDALRHRLSHLLCDSRRINDHFLELLVGGAPTEIRLRDCSWLSEEHFTKCFQTCDTTNLLVRAFNYLMSFCCT